MTKSQPAAFAAGFFYGGLANSSASSLRSRHSLVQFVRMTTQDKIEALLQQAAELPDEAQAELVQSLVEMRAQHLGIYHLDDEERAALVQSAEDIRLGRFATDHEIERIFAKYGA